MRAVERRSANALVLAACTVAGAPRALAEPKGHVQVEVPPGTEVAIDGHPRIVTRFAEGALFRNLSPGAHQVALFRPDHVSQEAAVWVEPGAITLLRARPFQPVPAPARGGYAALLVDTLPVRATVDVKALGWTKIPKSETGFVAARVPAGRYRLTFCTEHKCIDHDASLDPGEVKRLFVDFDPGVVEDATKSFLAGRAAASARCETGGGGDPNACLAACNVDLALAPGTASPACASLFGPPERSLATRGPNGPVEAASAASSSVEP